VLGNPQILRNDQPVSLPAKALALLSYLLVTGRPQRREHLLALLWPESAEEAARKNLRNTLWTIRTTLKSDVLRAEGDQLTLYGSFTSDFIRFESAASPTEALTFYNGPLLNGFNVVDAPDFEVWLTSERERLARRYQQLVEQVLEQYRASRNWDEVMSIAQTALRHDPCDEPALRGLLEALARRGQRTAALRQYEQFRRLLERELGLTPEPATETLHSTILQGQIEADMVAAPLPRLAEQRRMFVGRAAEQQALTTTLAEARVGQARVVVLSGEMGIGKTCLWREWAHNHQFLLLDGVCLEATKTVPFAALLTRLSDTTWAARVAQTVGAQMPVWLVELTRLLPSLQEVLPRPLSGGAPPAETRYQLFEAFVQALLAVTPVPHILVIDDLQWADPTTLDWLDYALERLRTLPVLLIVTYRTEDAEPSLLERIARWDRAGLVCRLPLARLTSNEAGLLLRKLEASSLAEEQLIATGAGNPYFLTELAQAAPGDIPPGLRDLIQARLERLPPATQPILQAAAVLEPDLDLTTLHRMGEWSENDLLDALDILLDSGILVEEREQYAFAHPLVATIVHTGLRQARRKILHQRAATILTELYATHLPALAGRLANHYQAANDLPQTAKYAELAGDYALNVAAPREAIVWYQQALALEPTPERQLKFGRALYWDSQLEAAEGMIRTAMAGFQAIAEPLGVALCNLALADLATSAGRFAAVGPLASAALALAGDQEVAIAAGAHLLLATVARDQGQMTLAEHHCSLALELATTHRLVDMLTYVALVRSNICAEQGDLRGALQAALDTANYARQAGIRFYEAVGHNNAAYRALLLGDYPLAQQQVAAGLQLTENYGLLLPRQWLYSTRGELALAEQQWADAEIWFSRAEAEAERHGNQRQAAMSRAHLGRAAASIGNIAKAVQLLVEASATSAEFAAHYQQIQIDLWLVVVARQAEDVALANEAYQRASAMLKLYAFPQLEQQLGEL
jgi:DNA-binding SARP family transcriptional activator